MTDITERLRLRTDPTQMLMCYPARPAPDMLCYEAAAEIEQLRAEIAALQAECEGVDAIGELVDEIEQLREALSEIVEECRNTGYGDPTVMERMIDRIGETASAAMRGRQND